MPTDSPTPPAMTSLLGDEMTAYLREAISRLPPDLGVGYPWWSRPRSAYGEPAVPRAMPEPAPTPARRRPRALAPPPRPDWPALLDEKESRRYLGDLSRARLRAALNARELPAPRPTGGKPMWLRAEVDRTLARRWGLSNGPDTSETDRVRNKMMEAARAFRPLAPRLGRDR